MVFHVICLCRSGENYSRSRFHWFRDRIAARIAGDGDPDRAGRCTRWATWCVGSLRGPVSVRSASGSTGCVVCERAVPWSSRTRPPIAALFAHWRSGGTVAEGTMVPRLQHDGRARDGGGAVGRVADRAEGRTGRLVRLARTRAFPGLVPVAATLVGTSGPRLLGSTRFSVQLALSFFAYSTRLHFSITPHRQCFYPG